MAGATFTSTIPNTFKTTIDYICTDRSDGLEDGLDMNKWVKVESMDDQYVDDLEIAGPGLIAEKPEGQELQTVTMREGFLTRYMARTFGAKMLVTEEAIEDCKYPEILNFAKKLKRSAYKTADIDMTSVASNAFSTSFPRINGLPVFSASHTLAQGGTFSNTLATAMAPSRLALQTMRTQAARMPGHDGVIEGYLLKKVVCPTDQYLVWKGILGSTQVPESNNNEINTIRELGLDVVELRYWTASSTQWFVITDNEKNFCWKWRKKLKSNSWPEPSNTTMGYSVRYRADKGISDARGALGSNA